MPLAKRLYGTLGQVWRLVQMCFDVMLVAAEPTALLIDCIGSLASRSAHMARLKWDAVIFVVCFAQMKRSTARLFARSGGKDH